MVFCTSYVCMWICCACAQMGSVLIFICFIRHISLELDEVTPQMLKSWEHFGQFCFFMYCIIIYILLVYMHCFLCAE